jgi:hypothetical protein
MNVIHKIWVCGDTKFMSDSVVVWGLGAYCKPPTFYNFNGPKI